MDYNIDRDKNLFILDRDGTINYDPGWLGRDPGWRSQIKILPGVVEGIKKLNKIGRVIVVSNQYGVARGYFNLETVLAINQELDKKLRVGGAIVENWQVCPYVDYDWAVKQGLDLNTSWVIKGDSPLRKPSSGMVERAAIELNMDYKNCNICSVGNREVDVEIGVRLGGKGIIIFDLLYEKEFKKVQELSKDNKNYFCVNNFLEAVDFIEKELY